MLSMLNETRSAIIRDVLIRQLMVTSFAILLPDCRVMLILGGGNLVLGYDLKLNL